MGNASTVLDRARTELAAICDELALDATIACSTFEALVRPCAWAHRPIEAPRLASGLSHRSPYGFSVTCGGALELGALVEAQAAHDDPLAYWAVGQTMTEALATRPHAQVERLRAIEDGFVPEARAPFRVWHGLRWDRSPRGLRDRYRIYLGARARAEPTPRARVRRALEQLDPALGETLTTVEAVMRPGDDFTILSLDLGPDDRVKVYVLQPEASWSALAPVWALAGHDDRAARCFVDRMSAPRPSPWWLTALTLAPGRVTNVALHFGSARHLPDAETSARLERLATELHLDVTPCRVLHRHQPRHHFLSFQLRAGRPRLTAYFAPAA